MERKELVSVIMPIFNMESKRIIKAVNSVFNQTYPLVELVIVDDGSTTRVYDLLKHVFKEQIDQFKLKIVRNNSNRGISHARNKAVKYSSGVWITYLDGDDYLSRNCVHNLYETAKNDIFAIGDCIVLDGVTKSLRSPALLFGEACQFNKSPKDPFMLNITSLQPQIIRKDIFLELDGFDESYKYAELTEFFLRFLCSFGIGRVSFSSGAIYYYSRNRNDSVSQINRQKLFDYRLKALNAYKNSCGIPGELLYKERNSRTGFQKYELRT